MAKKFKETEVQPPRWQNRIIDQGEKPAKDFKFNLKNWRQHPQSQRDALNGVLEKIGWVTGVIILPDGTLVDGHARIEEALKIGDETPVPFTMVNLTEKEAETMLALFDPLGAMAGADSEKLSELLAGMETDFANLSDIVGGLVNFPEEITSGDVPNLNDPGFNYQSRFGVIVECESETDQAQVYEKLRAEGYSCKVVVV